MKNYLDLVPISAKIHRKQSKMSIFCIVLSVFLVTVIFGMADMFIRSQIMQARIEYGNWHISIKDINDEQAKLISVRPEIENFSWYGVANFSGNEGVTLNNKNTVICGSNEKWATEMLVDFIVEGTFPQNDNEAIITEGAKASLGLQVGSQITINTPDKTELQFIISGFCQDTSKTMSEDFYGIFLTANKFKSIYPEDNGIYYVQFSPYCSIQKTINDIKLQFGLSDKQISENTKLLGLLGQSGDSFMAQIYGAAIILFILVMLAGVLMIASSLNSNIVQRTEFFGMIRCIGATPNQIMKLVRKEAVSWCKLAIPLGISIGIILIWALCAMLRYLSPDYFEAMPALAISLPSILAGTCSGILTVLLAARSPAKRASKVSPLVAVSGNANSLKPVHKAANTKFLKIDTALGIYHAKSTKKNFILMVGSFSLSIILFLAFSVTVDFMNHSITPLKPWTADISIISPDNNCSISSVLLQQVQQNPVVKQAYGRMFAYNIPVNINGIQKKVDLVSYEKNQFEWAKDYMLEGSLQVVQQEDYTGLIVFEQQNIIQAGDIVTLNFNNYSANIEIVGLLSSSPFNNSPDIGTIICSENTFKQITGISDYTIIDMQLKANATDTDVELIHQLAGTEFNFSDSRLKNRGTLGTYYSFGLFIYGFLAVIAMITVFNIINSIAMSVAARIKQYGVFRAIGLTNRQLEKMIVAEALTYAIFGSICGCIVGLTLNKFLYEKLVTFRWGEAWSIPFIELCIIIGIVIASVILAVQKPIKQIRKMSIVDTISAD